MNCPAESESEHAHYAEDLTLYVPEMIKPCRVDLPVVVESGIAADLPVIVDEDDGVAHDETITKTVFQLDRTPCVRRENQLEG